MTRILCWNIDHFALGRIVNAGVGPEPEYGGVLGQAPLSQSDAAAGRLEYIKQNLDIIDPNGNNIVRPDIVAVIEVTADQGAVGCLAVGQGRQGAIQLLTEIRNHTNNQLWMMVPPLCTSNIETVAVYYDSTTCRFTGPFRWQGGQGPSFDPNEANAPVAADYPADYIGCLPPADSQLAAATKFHAVADGGDIAYQHYERPPYWVTFADVAGARTYSVFVIHGPAGRNRAIAYVQKLATMREIVAPSADNEVRVLLGDFNFNLMNAEFVQQGYQPLIAADYALALKRPLAPPPPFGWNDFTGYRGYFATHMRSLGQATYWFVAGDAAYYPGFGYIGAGGSVRNDYSYDNILARFGLIPNSGNPCGTLEHATILNGVVSVPFSAYPPPNSAPPGYYQWPLQMQPPVQYNNPPQQILQSNVPDPRVGSFPQWAAYGHIRSTSTHMAVVADV
jgi:hypothetical protein